jgi:adenylate cyclase
MATEIERKFLVTGDTWKGAVEAERRIRPGYLTTDRGVTVRARIKGDKAFLTIKGPTEGISRSEYEYEIPVADAEAMLRDLAASGLIEKTRFDVRCGAHLWELDVFDGDNAGLVMAEIELSSPAEGFDMPDWAGKEVSDDPRYYNASLARHPYKHW